MTSNDIKIMKSVIRSFGNSISKSDQDDIMQTSMMRCVIAHKSESKRKFTTSLFLYTKWTCLNFIRDHGKVIYHPLTVNMAVPINDKQEDIDHVRECMGMLRNKDRDLVHQYFLLGMTYKEIGDLNGCSSQAIYRRLQNAIKRLREWCIL